MITAIFSRTYPVASAERMFSAVAEDGFDAVQANLSSAGLASLPAQLPPGVGCGFAHAAQGTGVRIAALSGTYNMAHPDPTVRQASRIGFGNVARAAREMGAPVVSLCTGSRNQQDMWKAHPENNSAAAWRDLRAELDFALGLAQDAGIRLAIEPEPANVIADARAARRLLDEVRSPLLGIILDAANLLSPETLAFQHRIIAEAASLLADSLLLAHAKDIDAAGHVVAPGTGAVDLMAFTRILRGVGYDGPLVAHGFPAKDARAAAITMRRLIDLTQ